MQSFYEHLQQTSDGVSHFLEIIAGSKKAQLLAIGSLKDQKLTESGSGSETTTGNEAASLLHVRSTLLLDITVWCFFVLSQNEKVDHEYACFV